MDAIADPTIVSFELRFPPAMQVLAAIISRRDELARMPGVETEVRQLNEAESILRSALRIPRPSLDGIGRGTWVEPLGGIEQYQDEDR